MDTDYITPGTPIVLASPNIRHSDIDCCVWYIDEQEISRSDRLTSYTPSSDDQEHFIRVSVSLKDGTRYEDSRYFSVLPVLYLNSDIAYENVTKEENTSVSVKLAAGSEYLPSQQYSGSAQIHLRGNSTSTLPKLPFKLKLEEKANLLNLGETSHWVLLANAIDSTLIRNKLVYDFSGDIGASCQMHSEFVSLIYNGEYQGVYQLCEQVRIGKNSVDIYDWGDAAQSAAEALASDLVYQKEIAREEQPIIQAFMEMDLLSDFSWMETGVFDSPSLRIWNQNGSNLTATYYLKDYFDFDSFPEASGGVLLEMDYFHKQDAALKTNYLLPFYFNTPSCGDTYPELYSYIRENLQVLEYALHDTDFTYHNASSHYRTDSEGWFDWGYTLQRQDVTYAPVNFYSASFDGVHYSELIDFDSLLVNFLLCEFTVNWDGMKNSVYLYKDIDGPFYIGPAWDYDWAWGNGCYDLDTWKPEIWQTTDTYFANEEYYQNVQWNRYLIRDPYFLTQIYKKYWEVRKSAMEDLIRDGGRIDQYAKKLKPAADANDARWGGCEGNFKGQKFDEGITSLKDFIRQRIAWLDQQFASIESLRCSLGYYITSDTLSIEPVSCSFPRGLTLVTVHATEPGYASIAFQVNGTHFYTAEITDGTAVLLIPDCVLQEETDAWNTIQARALDENGTYIINPEGTVPGDYTNAVSNYICFTKD